MLRVDISDKEKGMKKRFFIRGVLVCAAAAALMLSNPERVAASEGGWKNQGGSWKYYSFADMPSRGWIRRARLIILRARD